MAATHFGTAATIFFRNRRSELSRQIAVDFEADADLNKGRSGPGHGLLLITRARPPSANNAPTYLSVRSRATAGQRMYGPSRAFVSLQPRQIVGQIHDVLIGH